MISVSKHGLYMKLQFQLKLDPSVAYQGQRKLKPEHTNKRNYTLEVVWLQACPKQGIV